MTNESYEERLDKRLTYVDELKARIAELESEAAAFDTALWSGRLQEVEQCNANANARIAELEAQVAEMQPVWEAVGRLEDTWNNWRQRWNTLHVEFAVASDGQTIATITLMTDSEYEQVRDVRWSIQGTEPSLSDALETALKKVVGE